MLTDHRLAVQQTEFLLAPHGFGILVTARLTQRALGLADCRVSVDGFFGPKTLSALNIVSPAKFISAMQAVFATRIADIVNRRPTNAKFQSGWKKRLERLSTLLGQVEGKEHGAV